MMINLNSRFSFDWGHLSYMDYDISNSFIAIRKLNSNQEYSLSESKKELEEKIASIKDYNKDGEEEFIETYIHHLTHDDEIMIDEIQRLQRYSIVMSIFAFYEGQLKSVCTLIEEEFDFKIKIKDLNNYKGDLVKYWTYLDKVYGMETHALKSLFDPLIIQKKIRNIIVHHDGIVTQKIANELPKTDGISFKKSGEFLILQIEETIYVELLLSSIEVFFKELHKEIDKKYTKLNHIKKS